LAQEDNGKNPGRTGNKAREQLRAVMSWAWEQELIESLPRFPKARNQLDVAGRHYLTKSELNSLYFATYNMKRPRGWVRPYPVGKYWRCALVLFFNYGLDTGTIWPSKTDSLATHFLESKLSRWSIKRTISMGLAVLPTREDRKGILSTDEPSCSRPCQEFDEYLDSTRRSACTWWQLAAQCPIQSALQTRWDSIENESRIWQ
jgi:hypothetical protein